MSNEIFSILVWFWNGLEPQTPHTTMVRVMRVDTGEYVPLQAGSFLLRVSTESARVRPGNDAASYAGASSSAQPVRKEEDAGILRCHIRHIASGQEAHIQSGQTLQTFILSSILDTGAT